MRLSLPLVPLVMAIFALLLGHFRPTLYLWVVVPLWYFVNILVMVYPFVVLFPSPHARYAPHPVTHIHHVRSLSPPLAAQMAIASAVGPRATGHLVDRRHRGAGRRDRP